MSGHLDEKADRLRALPASVEDEVSRQQERWHYDLHRNRVRFEGQARVAHRRLKRSLLRFLRQSSIPNLLTAPVIYSLILPLVLLDAWISIYQRVCFPIYGIPRVSRASVHHHRPASPWVPEQHREGKLRVPQLRQRSVRVCA